MKRKEKQKRGYYYAAEQILEERRSAAGPEYLIRWQGYKPRHDSWSKEVTTGLLKTWTGKQKTRRWSKLILAEKILRDRGKGEQREFLVKFLDFEEPEWTIFVSESLLLSWENKHRKKHKKEKSTRKQQKSLG